MGYRRMQVERHVERVRAFEDRPEPSVVEKEPVGEPVHHSSLEPESGDRALEFVGGRLGIGSRQRGKGGKPVRMGAHRLAEAVIGPARQWHSGFRVQLLKPRHRMRQHLHVNAGFVHFS
jgi:hypothetical protein